MEINPTVQKIGKFIAVIIVVSLVKVMVSEFFLQKKKNDVDMVSSKIDASKIELERKFTPNVIIYGPKGDNLVNQNAKLDNPIYENIITGYKSYVLSSKRFHFLEFFYDYEFSNSEISYNIDTAMKDVSRGVQKSLNYEFISEKFTKENNHNTYRGVFKTNSSTINFFFVAIKRGKHAGIVGTITTDKFSDIQEQIIKKVTFLYPFEKIKIKEK